MEGFVCADGIGAPGYGSKPQPELNLPCLDISEIRELQEGSKPSSGL